MDKDLLAIGKALVMITAIRDALDRGCIHRNKAGVILRTDREIVECILAEGGVEVEEPPASER